MLKTFEKNVINYLDNLDSAIEILSNKNEGKLSNLPSWVLCTRNIEVIAIKSKPFLAVKIIPDSTLMEDHIVNYELNNEAELIKYLEKDIPIKYSLSLNEESVIAIGDLKIGENVNRIEGKEEYLLKGALYIGGKISLMRTFSVDEAKKDAINLWNNAFNNFTVNTSFTSNISNLLFRMGNLINRKGFLERKLHRFINEYGDQILIPYENKYFEHKLFLSKNERIADFILKKEKGFPPYLIELERPWAKIFNKSGELTKEANHAKFQISEWVRFIDSDPINVKGEMSFLKGPKQRLVIMGRETVKEELMELNSKYTDTIIWSYPVLIEEVKKRWNNIIITQCKTLRIKDFSLIK